VREPWKRLAPEARRAQIVEIAGTLFGARPYDELGIADVAKAAGITQGLIYHYYPTKEALFVAAFDQFANALLASCLPDPALPLPEQADGGVRGYLDFAEANRVAYLNLFRGPRATEPDFLRIAEETRRALIDHFLTTLAVRELEVPATLLSLRAYLGYAESATVDWLERRPIPRAALERLILAALGSAIVTGLAADDVVPPAMGSLSEFHTAFHRHFDLP
jgi:AcrR family transcriptional regulator